MREGGFVCGLSAVNCGVNRPRYYSLRRRDGYLASRNEFIGGCVCVCVFRIANPMKYWENLGKAVRCDVEQWNMHAVAHYVFMCGETRILRSPNQIYICHVMFSYIHRNVWTSLCRSLSNKIHRNCIVVVGRFITSQAIRCPFEFLPPSHVTLRPRLVYYLDNNNDASNTSPISFILSSLRT